MPSTSCWLQWVSVWRKWQKSSPKKNFTMSKSPKYSNMAYSSNILLLTHQNGDLLISKHWKLFKYGLLVQIFAIYLLQFISTYPNGDLLILKNGKIFKYGLLNQFLAPNFTYSSQWWLTQPENVPKVKGSVKVSLKFKILK